MRGSTSLLACLLTALALTPTVRAWCADEPAKGKDVKVSVVTIIASETDTFIDPKLESIAKEVQKIHPKLVGFRMSKMACKSIPVNGSETFDILTDQKASVTVNKMVVENEERVQITIKPPSLGEITYTTTCDKFFPIVTRYHPTKKEILILAVRCQSCPDKKK